MKRNCRAGSPLSRTRCSSRDGGRSFLPPDRNSDLHRPRCWRLAIVFHAVHTPAPRSGAAPAPVAQVDHKVDEAEIARSVSRPRSRRRCSRTRGAAGENGLAGRERAAGDRANGDTRCDLKTIAEYLESTGKAECAECSAQRMYELPEQSSEIRGRVSGRYRAGRAASVSPRVTRDNLAGLERLTDGKLVAAGCERARLTLLGSDARRLSRRLRRGVHGGSGSASRLPRPIRFGPAYTQGRNRQAEDSETDPHRQC